MGTEAPSTVWLLWTLLLETLGCRCPGVSLHLNLWGKSPTVQLLGRRGDFFFFLKILFIYDSHRERERERGRDMGEPDVGLDPRCPGSRSGLKAALNRCAAQAARVALFLTL